jgi:hypothetical protein
MSVKYWKPFTVLLAAVMSLIVQQGVCAQKMPPPEAIVENSEWRIGRQHFGLYLRYHRYGPGDVLQHQRGGHLPHRRRSVLRTGCLVYLAFAGNGLGFTHAPA